ncbi:GntR family transcriptional regulator [Sanguibacter suaedae]|uniref:GntR family transcriptional regulator n=1 Tax=Sanguibacter suaedae TaxID=2795737 RepID=A0A934I9V7_9MICO|nr:GntR family transcriptional regulator [Sanguibacter suaedae]MBI9113880.1 GntR family transcriptional regulator [Sanguibacter suaedae]
MPSPTTRTSSRRAVYDALRNRIITLDLPPGSPLSENELAATLGVSRTPVRESLILLQQEGLVQVFPKVGSFVSRVDPERVADAQFLREAVELASLDDLPDELDPEIVDEMRENLALQQATTDMETFFQLDEAFHHGLLRLAGHGRTWPTVSAAKGHLDRARHLGLQEKASTQGFLDQHLGILEAVLTQQRETARTLVRDHLRAVFADIESVQRHSPELFASNTGTAPRRRSVAVWS